MQNCSKQALFKASTAQGKHCSRQALFKASTVQGKVKDDKKFFGHFLRKQEEKDFESQWKTQGVKKGRELKRNI